MRQATGAIGSLERVLARSWGDPCSSSAPRCNNVQNRGRPGRQGTASCLWPSLPVIRAAPGAVTPPETPAIDSLFSIWTSELSPSGSEYVEPTPDHGTSAVGCIVLYCTWMSAVEDRRLYSFWKVFAVSPAVLFLGPAMLARGARSQSTEGRRSLLDAAETVLAV